MKSSLLLLGSNDRYLKKIALKQSEPRRFLSPKVRKEIIIYDEVARYCQSLENRLNGENFNTLQIKKLYIAFEVARVNRKTLIVIGIDKFFVNRHHDIKYIVQMAKNENVALIATAQSFDIHYADLFDKILFGKTNDVNDLFFERRSSLSATKFLQMKLKPSRVSL